MPHDIRPPTIQLRRIQSRHRLSHFSRSRELELPVREDRRAALPIDAIHKIRPRVSADGHIRGPDIGNGFEDPIHPPPRQRREKEPTERDVREKRPRMRVGEIVGFGDRNGESGDAHAVIWDRVLVDPWILRVVGAILAAEDETAVVQRAIRVGDLDILGSPRGVEINVRIRLRCVADVANDNLPCGGPDATITGLRGGGQTEIAGVDWSEDGRTGSICIAVCRLRGYGAPALAVCTPVD